MCVCVCVCVLCVLCGVVLLRRAIGTVLSGRDVNKLVTAGLLCLNKAESDACASLAGARDKGLVRYRAVLQTAAHAGEAAVPYMGAHMADLTYLEEATVDSLEANNLTNFFKRLLVSDELSLLEALQLGRLPKGVAVSPPASTAQTNPSASPPSPIKL